MIKVVHKDGYKISNTHKRNRKVYTHSNIKVANDHIKEKGYIEPKKIATGTMAIRISATPNKAKKPVFQSFEAPFEAWLSC